VLALKRFLLAFLLIAVVALSGCIGQRSVNIDANNGLLISTFSVDPVKVDEGDQVLVLMDVENVGGVTARDIRVNFYGAEGWGGDKNKTLGKDLKPPDPITGTPGDFKTVTATLTAPQLPEGVQLEFPITARVVFSYKTTGGITIPAYSEDLYKINTEQGRTMETEAKVSNTNAPLKVSLSRGPTPLVVGNESEETTYVIEFKNVGSGWPFKEGDIGKLQGKIKVYGAELIECLDVGVGTDNTVTLDLPVFQMRSTGSVPVSCSVNIPGGWSPTQSGSVVFTVDIDYDYYVEKAANVMVWGGKS